MEDFGGGERAEGKEAGVEDDLGPRPAREVLADEDTDEHDKGGDRRREPEHGERPDEGRPADIDVLAQADAADLAEDGKGQRSAQQGNVTDGGHSFGRCGDREQRGRERGGDIDLDRATQPAFLQSVAIGSRPGGRREISSNRSPRQPRAQLPQPRVLRRRSESTLP
jgi:hypothetical protein